jgi:hypothetical protein
VSNSTDGGATFSRTIFDGRVLAQESQISVVRSPHAPETIYFSGPTAIKGVYPAGPRHRSLTGTRARGRVQTSTDSGDSFNTGPDGAGGVFITGWHDVGAPMGGPTGHWPDTFGYSSLSEVPGGSGIGLLFESGASDCIGPYSEGSSGTCAIRFAVVA